MFEKARAFLLSLTIIAVLVFSAVGTTVVYADGGTPTEETAEPATEAAGEGEKPGTVTVDTVETPAPEEKEPAEVGDDEGAPAQELAPRVPTEEEDAPGEETGSTSEKPIEPAPAVETPILDAVPENTTVTVLDAAGKPQPLATDAAADAIATSDPIWCPAGQAPTPGQNGCTQSFNSFTALLNFLAGNVTYS